MLVGPFEDALFAMQVGEVSAPVQSEFGFHIIRLDEIRAGELQPYEAVREELRGEYQATRAADLFYERANQLTDSAFDAYDELASVASAQNLPLKTLNGFPRSGDPAVFVNSAAGRASSVRRGNSGERQKQSARRACRRPRARAACRRASSVNGAAARGGARPDQRRADAQSSARARGRRGERVLERPRSGRRRCGARDGTRRYVARAGFRRANQRRNPNRSTGCGIRYAEADARSHRYETVRPRQRQSRRARRRQRAARGARHGCANGSRSAPATASGPSCHWQSLRATRATCGSARRSEFRTKFSSRRSEPAP